MAPSISAEPLSSRFPSLLRLAALAIALLGAPPAAFAGTLYALTSAGYLLEVDPATAARTQVGVLEFSDPGSSRGVVGLAAAPDGSRLYTTHERIFVEGDLSVRGSAVAIDPTTGVGVEFPAFDPAQLDLFMPEDVSDGVGGGQIAISSSNPGVGVVTALQVDFESLNTVPHLWTFDLATGSVLGPAVRLESHIFALAFSPDGSTLFGARRNATDTTVWDLITIDPITGSIGFVGEVPGSVHAATLAFDGDGTLYTVGSKAMLVTLDPATGAVLEVRGPLYCEESVGTIQGFAFLSSPEPSTALLLGLGLTVLAARRRLRVR